MGTLVIHLLDILYLSSMSIIFSIITCPPFFFSMLLCDFLMYTLHISPSALCHYVLVLFPLCWFYFSFRFSSAANLLSHLSVAILLFLILPNLFFELFMSVCAVVHFFEGIQAGSWTVKAGSLYKCLPLVSSPWR